MTEKQYIVPPTGRSGKDGVYILRESIEFNVQEDQTQRFFQGKTQTIPSDGKDDTFFLKLTPTSDKRDRRMIVAAVFVESRKALAYFALEKQQEHYSLIEGKEYLCRRNHYNSLYPIGGIDVYTIEIIKEEKPAEAVAAEIPIEEIEIKKSRSTHMVTVLEFPDAKTAALGQEMLGAGWYLGGKEIKKIHGQQMTAEETAAEDALILSLPEKIKMLLQEEEKEKEKKSTATVTVADSKLKQKRRKTYINRKQR